MSPSPIKKIDKHKYWYQKDSEHGDNVGDGPHNNYIPWFKNLVSEYDTRTDSIKNANDRI